VIRGWTATETQYSVDVHDIPFWTCGFFREAACLLSISNH
jgi:hypothetical protein